MGTTKIETIRKAVKFASKDARREILMGVHLDESGDVVATDSYRLFCEHGAYVGESIDVPSELARKIAKGRAKGVVELYRDGEDVVAKFNGTEERGRAPYGKYPNYGTLLKNECVAIAYANVKQIVPLLKEYKRKKAKAIVEVRNRNLCISGSGAGSPSGRFFEKQCDGEDVSAAFNPDFLKTAVEACGKWAELHIEAPLKPMLVKNGELVIVLMPVNMDATEETKKVERAKAIDKTAKEKFGPNANAALNDMGGVTVVIDPPNRKAKPPKTEVVVTTAQVVPTRDGYKATPIESHVETVEPIEVEPIEETAAAVTLETMREWAKDKPSVRIEQKREGAPLWVCGETKPYKAELAEMGFAWGKSKTFGKGWWK